MAALSYFDRPQLFRGISSPYETRSSLSGRDSAMSSRKRSASPPLERSSHSRRPTNGPDQFSAVNPSLRGSMAYRSQPEPSTVAGVAPFQFPRYKNDDVSFTSESISRVPPRSSSPSFTSNSSRSPISPSSERARLAGQPRLPAPPTAERTPAAALPSIQTLFSTLKDEDQNPSAPAPRRRLDGSPVPGSEPVFGEPYAVQPAFSSIVVSPSGRNSRANTASSRYSSAPTSPRTQGVRFSPRISARTLHTLEPLCRGAEQHRSRAHSTQLPLPSHSGLPSRSDLLPAPYQQHSRSQTLPGITTHQAIPMHPTLPPARSNDPFAPARDPQYRQMPAQIPPMVLLPQGPYEPNISLTRFEPSGPYAYSFGMNGQSNGYHSNRKRRGNLPKEATRILRQWFDDHHDSPYPTEEDKNHLCKITGLQMTQVNNWFINARRRIDRGGGQRQSRRPSEESETDGDGPPALKRRSPSRMPLLNGASQPTPQLAPGLADPLNDHMWS